MLALLTFEDIFSLPEVQIDNVLNRDSSAPKNFLNDRYLATIAFADKGQLTARDDQCTTEPRFRALYLNENLLMEAKVKGYVNRFDRLRQILGYQNLLTPLCDEAGIKSAIDRYNSELLNIGVLDLEKEFGCHAFNSRYLNMVHDALSLARRPMDQSICLSPIVFNTIRDYNSMEKSYSGTPFWVYSQRLVSIIQSDPKTAEHC